MSAEGKPELSIVIPVYNGRVSVPILVERLEQICAQLHIENYEIFLVDDCAPDNAWPVIESLSAKNPRCVGVRLMRNFGQHPAILAGLHLAKGKYIVVMDCDLQDDPAALPELYNRIRKSGKDAVIVQAVNKRGGVIRWLTSRLFYKTFNKLVGVDMKMGIGNFGIYARSVRDTIVNEFSDVFFYLPCFVHWLGLDVDYLQFECADRLEGKSGYSFLNRLLLATEIIVSFSTVPLYYMAAGGVFFFIISGLNICTLIIGHFNHWFSVAGWVSVICALFIFTSVIVTFLGIVGIYTAKIFEQTKMRPRYLIRSICK